MNSKTELLVRIINLIIIVGLCFAIYLNGTGLDCTKCELGLTTYKPQFNSTSSTQENLRVKITDLYNSIKEDNCILRWDKSRGWIYNG